MHQLLQSDPQEVALYCWSFQRELSNGVPHLEILLVTGLLYLLTAIATIYFLLFHPKNKDTKLTERGLLCITGTLPLLIRSFHSIFDITLLGGVSSFHVYIYCMQAPIYLQFLSTSVFLLGLLRSFSFLRHRFFAFFSLWSVLVLGFLAMIFTAKYASRGDFSRVLLVSNYLSVFIFIALISICSIYFWIRSSVGQLILPHFISKRLDFCRRFLLVYSATQLFRTVWNSLYYLNLNPVSSFVVELIQNPETYYIGALINNLMRICLEIGPWVWLLFASVGIFEVKISRKNSSTFSLLINE
ncbi:hypothetical protein RCL1_008477 [Eukaryota sp. TZLM3-RCL]